MEIVPQLPAVMGDADGAVTVFASRHMRNAVASAFEALGGVQGLVDWANTNLETKTKFYTGLAAKLIVKEVEISDRSIEDVIDQLDSGVPVSAAPTQEAVDAAFEEFYE